MKKDNYSDYVRMAYIYYVACGCPDKISIRDRRMAAETAKQRAAVEDLEAVAQTLDHIRMLPDADDVEYCLRKVYFHDKLPRAGATTALVNDAARNIHASDVQVYRILRNCRRITASIRGLRVEDDSK